MVRRIQRRTRGQWEEEIRRIRRIREAVQLEMGDDVVLKADVMGRLDAVALLLELWLAMIWDDLGSEQ